MKPLSRCQRAALSCAHYTGVPHVVINGVLTVFPEHIHMGFAGDIVCHKCGASKGYPVGPGDAKTFIDAHRDCGTTTTAREGEE